MNTTLTRHIVRVPVVLAGLIMLIALCAPVPPAAAQTGTSQQPLVEQELVALINQARQQAQRSPSGTAYPPCRPLTVDSRLAQAARGHAADMAAKNYFNHISMDGRRPNDRIRTAGFAYSMAGEALAAGNATAQATFNQMLPTFIREIMNCRYTHVGGGYGYNSNARYGHYWTVNFATPAR